MLFRSSRDDQAIHRFSYRLEILTEDAGTLRVCIVFQQNENRRKFTHDSVEFELNSGFHSSCTGLK